MSLLSRIAKKIKRRFRRKGTYEYGKVYTLAQRLIDSNYGISFKWPIPALKGAMLAFKWLVNHRKQWAKTPVNKMISSQVRRATLRRYDKDFRMITTDKFTQKQTTQKQTA